MAGNVGPAIRRLVLVFLYFVVVGTVAARGYDWAQSRHFNVDELQVAANTALWCREAPVEMLNYIEPFQSALVRLISPSMTTRQVLGTLRTAFLVLLMVNFGILALGQRAYPTVWGVLAVLVTATLHFPLWLHGFEIRSDVLLLTGNLLLYAIAARAADSKNPSMASAVAAGVVGGMMQATASKSVVYWGPFALLTVVVVSLAEDRSKRSWFALRSGAAAGCGVVAGAAAALACLIPDGMLMPFLQGLRAFYGVASQSSRFSALPSLSDLATQAPAVFVLAVLQTIVTLFTIANRSARGRQVVTSLFFVWSVVALLLNPTPFGYNTIHAAAFSCIAVTELFAATGFLKGSHLVCAFAGLWAVQALDMTRDAALPYARMTNQLQLGSAELAEFYTGPDDPVYDGVGLVVSRNPPQPGWMMHSLLPNMGANRRVFDTPPPVVITNHRWHWLPSELRESIERKYVSLTPAVWVLGARGPCGVAEVEIERPGRYYAAIRGPDAALQIDGTVVPSDGVVPLKHGKHRIRCPASSEYSLQWLGPTGTPMPTARAVFGSQLVFLTR